jgi:hypothetical protein
MPLGTVSGLQSQIDKLQVGTSPRFTAITASTKVRDGAGICIGVQLGIAAAAGGTVQMFDGDPAGAGVAISPIYDATKGPIMLWLYQSFAQSLYIKIAVAVTDCSVITAGI